MRIFLPIFNPRPAFWIQFILTLIYTFAMYYCTNYRDEPASENIIPITLFYFLLIFVARGGTIVRVKDGFLKLRFLVLFRYSIKLADVSTALNINVKDYSYVGIGLRWLPKTRIFRPATSEKGFLLKYKGIDYILMGSEPAIDAIVKECGLTFSKGSN